ncbi:MAG: acyl-CoA dehydratase activase [Chitinispirillia bacterium]|jgi:predicted CoA-substrate-specific enzyme activase
MIAIGIDLGTAATKVVFADHDSIHWAKAVTAVPQSVTLGRKLIAEGKKSHALKGKDIIGIAATGYGKNLFPDALKRVDEISANAAGIYHLSNRQARSVINIGGQDVKFITLSAEGKVLDFKMNDKCAAGTGRFFEMASRILDTPLEQFGGSAFQSQKPVTINSTCAVFAESEIVSLLSMGVVKNDIISGIQRAVARRIYGLIGNASLDNDIFLDGGPSTNEGLRLALEEELLIPVKVLSQPQFTVAFGAARILIKDVTRQ